MNQNGGIHKGGFAVLCHRNGGSESPGILRKALFGLVPRLKLRVEAFDEIVGNVIPETLDADIPNA